METLFIYTKDDGWMFKSSQGVRMFLNECVCHIHSTYGVVSAVEQHRDFKRVLINIKDQTLFKRETRLITCHLQFEVPTNIISKSNACV